MPAETGAAATNAYNTAMALATTEAACLAKVVVILKICCLLTLDYV